MRRGVFAALLLASSVHLPFPLFREVLFEEIRNAGLYVFLGWILVFLFTLFRHRNRTLSLVVSGMGVALMALPMLPFGFQSFGGAFSDDQEEQIDKVGKTPGPPIQVDLREGLTSFADISPPAPSEQIVVVALQSPELGQDAVPDWAKCFQSFETSRMNPSFVITSLPCETLTHFDLVTSKIPALRVDAPRGAGHVLPIYVVIDAGGGSREAFYQNYLALRRLVARIKFERKAILVIDTIFTPWSKIYRSLGSGGKLVDAAWGEWDIFSNPSARLFKTKTVLYKGAQITERGDSRFSFQTGDS